MALFCLAAAPALAAAPTIKSFTPASGPIGTSITINGTAFTGTTAVRVGGVAASFRLVSATQLVATLPATPTSTIAVVTPGGSATSGTSFTVTPGALASPAQAHPGANITVTASGMDPFTSMDVFFDSTDVALAVSNSHGIASLTIAVPANATPIKHWITFDQRSNHKAVQAPLAINTDWLEGRFSFNGSGYNPYEGALSGTTVPDLEPLWAKPNGIYSNYEPPVEANGTIFVNDVDGNIQAYSATGALVWKASAGGFMSGRNPVIYGSRVYFSNGTNVFAYSTTCGKAGATCKPLWTATINSNNAGGLTQYKGTLYIGSTDGNVYPINPATGKLGTPFYAFGNTAGGITSPITFSANGAFGYTSYGAAPTLHVDYGNGAATQLTNANGISPVTFYGDLAYYETADGMLHELGGKGWNATLSGNCATAPAAAYGIVFAGDCNYVWGFNTASGSALWSFAAGSVSGISVANHVVYACANYAIVALNASNGAYLWTGGRCTGAPLVANGTIYATYANLLAYTIPSLSPDIARNAPPLDSLRRNRNLRLIPVRTPERLSQ